MNWRKLNEIVILFGIAFFTATFISHAVRYYLHINYIIHFYFHLIIFTVMMFIVTNMGWHIKINDAWYRFEDKIFGVEK